MIGILYIATGKYKMFFDVFYKSIQKYFIKDCKKEILVFTDEPMFFSEYKSVKVYKIDFNDFPLD